MDKRIRKDRIGETNTNKYGSNMTIIEYNTISNIIVEFKNKFQKKTSYKQFLKGYVSNPYDKSYYIHHYKNLYRPIDYSFPNNCSGLIIEEVNNSAISIPGCTITGSVDQLDLSRAYNEKLERNIETYKYGIEMADKWHTYSKEEINKKYKAQIEEVKSVILEN